MRRRIALGGLLILLSALAALVLAEVLQTVVFAITVAYVLYPPRQELVRRGFSPRVSGILVTASAGIGAVASLAPIGYVLYRRREELLGIIQAIPAVIPVDVGGAQVVFETGPVLDALRQFVREAAVAAATAAPVLALKLTLFVIVVYGLLYRPSALRQAMTALVPENLHDLARALHERTRATLLGIYVLQAVTAVGTTIIAFVVFAALGYGAAASLAVIAGILQFIPVVGPSLVVLGLAAGDLLAGNPTRAVLVLVFGLTLVGFLPDAVIRPRLANVAADLPVTLYFVGFVGGVLTLGAIGFVVGPLVVALLVETVEQLSVHGDPMGED